MLGLDSTRKFKNITFKNCFYNGKWLGSFLEGDFNRNEYVENISFVLDSSAVASKNKAGISDTPRSIFFNQAGNTLCINLAGKPFDKVQIFDVTGKVVYTDNVITQDARIDITGFSSGIYILTIRTSKSLQSTKLWLR